MLAKYARLLIDHENFCGNIYQFPVGIYFTLRSLKAKLQLILGESCCPRPLPVPSPSRLTAFASTWISPLGDEERVWLPRAPVLTQQYQFQKVVEGADLRSTGMCPGALLFPATHQTALMNVVCASSLWFYRSHLEYFRAQKIFTMYLLLMNHSECKCVSNLLRKNKPEGPRMLRDTGRTPKVLPPPPPSPHSQGQERSGAELWPWCWVLLSRVQSQVSARFTGGRTEIHRREDRGGCDGKGFLLLNLEAPVGAEWASWGRGRGSKHEVTLVAT